MSHRMYPKTSWYRWLWRELRHYERLLKRQGREGTSLYLMGETARCARELRALIEKGEGTCQN